VGSGIELDGGVGIENDQSFIAGLAGGGGVHYKKGLVLRVAVCELIIV